MDQTSNEYSLYIPRVALSSSSSSNSSRLKEFAPKGRRANGEVSETSGESESEGIYGSSIQNYGGLRAHRNRMYFVHKAPKRASHSPKSSSASSASNHSNYSVNSLLLSVKNLENFNKSSESKQEKSFDDYFDRNPNIILKPNFYNNYVINYETNNYPISEYRSKMLQNIRNISTPSNRIIPPASIKREKEADAISTASTITTTNFTVVSLNDSHQRLNKSKPICRRSQQITILIFIMTVLFIIGISLMLVLMDMRNQKMPR